MKHLMLLAAFALLLLSGCQQCGGNRGIFVDETDQQSQVVLDPAEVQRESPPLHALLEEAYQDRSEGTWDQDDRASIEDYLGTKGFRLPVLVGYRDKVFEVGHDVC